MSVEAKQKAPAFDPQLLNQLLAERKTAGEIEDLLKDLRKAFIEHALQGELTHLLGYQKHRPAGHNRGNSRNGSSPKRVKTDDSEVDIRVPRDRDGEFEPRLLAKHQRRWEGFDETILALYARGMTTRDIQSFLPERYEVEISPEFVSSVCDSVSAGVAEWRTRPLQAVYPVLYLDALFLKVREEGKVVSKALYVAVGVDLRGHKQLLGLWARAGRGREVLPPAAQRTESAGPLRHLHHLRRRAQGVAGGGRERLPADDRADLCGPPPAPQPELRRGEGAPGRGSGLEARLPGGH